MSESSIPLIVIEGPTAAGKTALGVHLCTNVNGEIISADSRQFYRFMNIGTAKPALAELTRVHHHLIDIAFPDETVGLAQFLNLARKAVVDIVQAGKIPFLVGGTGQYIKALLQGWQVPEVPPDPELRAQLEENASADPEGVWQQLLALDPEVEAFIDKRNIRRVVRALEVCLKSQLPYSELRRRTPPPYRVLQVGLTTDRQALYARADQRVDWMMAIGLLAEVEQLLTLGYDWSLPSMSGLGYSQFRPYFDKQATFDEVTDRIKLDTHDFIRRQYNWFRITDPDIHWLDIQDPARIEQAQELVSDFVSM